MALYGIGVAFISWLGYVVWRHLLGVVPDRPELLVLFYQQADEVEGMVRRFARHPAFALVLVDTGSDDDTAAILQRLAGRFGLRFCYAPEGHYGGLPYDARGLQGKELLYIPLL